MLQYQFIVLVCAGMLAILGAVKIVTEAILKKESAEIKKPCGDRFMDHSGKIKILEDEAAIRNNRLIKLEINYGHILEKITRIEIVIDKNAEMTRQIYAWMDKRKSKRK